MLRHSSRIIDTVRNHKEISQLDWGEGKRPVKHPATPWVTAKSSGSYLPGSMEAHAVYLLPHLKLGLLVLDFGCGQGTISVGLAGAMDPGEVHGVD